MTGALQHFVQNANNLKDVFATHPKPAAATPAQSSPHRPCRIGRRVFRPDEDTAAGRHVAFLSHAFWQRRFGGDPKVIGQSLALDGESYTVVGVAPPVCVIVKPVPSVKPEPALLIV